MSRLVQPRAPGVKAFAGDDAGENVREYVERVAKYVPAEVIAAYLGLVPVVIGTTDANTGMRDGLLAVVLVGCVVFTPLYLRLLARPGEPKRLQMVVSTLAFVIWAYSIGGFFTEIDLYHEAIAAITVTFYTLGTGLIVPTTGTP